MWRNTCVPEFQVCVVTNESLFSCILHATYPYLVDPANQSNGLSSYPTTTDFVCVYSCRASNPFSLPIPESFVPPLTEN